MNRRLLSFALVAIGGLCVSLMPLGQAAEKTAAERGRDIMFGRSLNPAVWSLKAYENAWKQWGLSEKPANFDQMFIERYGVHRAPFDNKGRPMGLLESKSFLGKGIVNNCLLCHAGTVAGQTVIGLGNASLDLQALFEEMSAADGFKMDMPFRFSYVRGTIDPVSPLTFLMEFRDAELELLKQPMKLGYSRNVCSDPPAWWLLKKKKTRDWTGSIDARSTRVDMVNLLTPLNSGAYIKQQEAGFADISAYLLTIEPPKYPFPVDEKLAERGQALFVQTCAKCHGTYGPDVTYPNKIVELGTIGTDSTLVESLTPPLGEHFNKSWFAREIGPDGKPFQIMESLGYQAPPLDGVWATAPYLHNSSVPTVYHVLNSKARPKIHTRSYKTGKEEYDPVKLGWKITVLDRAPGPDAPAIERRKVYDTTLPGQGNEGHIFGDKFTEDERMAVIEYLKTL